MAVVLGAPAAVEAQLLPNLPTRKRERPPCVTEPPFYSAVRHQYFGYYPTCWRKFPPGWACPCPNPELPDFQRSLQDRPLRVNEETGTPRDGAGTGDEFEGPDRRPKGPGTGSDMVPPVPNEEKSPFDLPTGPAPTMPPLEDQPAPPPGRGRSAPDRRPSAPRSEVTPVPTPAPEAGAPPAATPSAATERLDLPPVAEAAPEVPPLAQARPQPGIQPAADSAPLPPLAETTAATPMPATPEPTLPAPTTAASPADATPAPIPLSPATQAPARRGVISGIFNRMRRR